MAAARVLRRDMHFAAAWLAHVSTASGYPLPLGNGTNGPWNRIGCVTPDGYYGMVDIASGIAIETDAIMPWRVARFATPISRAQSPHDAGGTGGVPQGWRQIAVILCGQNKSRRHMPTVVTVTHVTYGLSTCYGTIGSDPRKSGYWAKKWMLPTAAWAETDEPQREEIKMGMGVQSKMWDEFRRTLPGYVSASPYISTATLTTSGGNYSVGEEKLVYIYMFGSKQQRQMTEALVRAAWGKWLAVRLCRDLYFALEKNGINVPNNIVRTSVSLGYLGGNRSGATCTGVMDQLRAMLGLGVADNSDVQI